MKYILGLMVIGVGYCMLVYSQKIREFVGTWRWAENMFGIGGTYTGIKLAGVVLIMLSFMYMTNTLEFLMRATLLRLLLPGQNFDNQ